MLLATTAERGWTKERQDFIHSSPSSPTQMTFPVSRATSPTSLVPFRFGSRTDDSQAGKGKEGFMGTRSRRSSINSRKNGKGKEPVYGKDSVDSSISPTSSSFGADAFSPSRYNASSSFTPYDTSVASASDEGPKKTQRGSILGTASDALGFKFRRRKPTIRQPPMPIILPGVMEIKAPGLDEEMEERNRLRDMAAISIGLNRDPPKVDDQPLEESVEEADEEEVEEGAAPVIKEVDIRDSPNMKAWESLSNPERSPHSSSFSITNTSAPGMSNRYRPGSILAHSRSNSTTLAPVPAFPVALTALNQFKQAATSFHKYYPPSSLRIFALSKNWRSRFIVLSSPTALVTRGSSPPVSYLHLFKSASGDEKEVERLEINEESVVFVAEEDVGGRKHVVKVGGIDVGALKKEWNHEENGRTMWFLHTTDLAEAQKWISSIKTAILGQRSMRAGYGILPNTSNFEPRGDMDVMLSIRAQEMMTSPASTSPHHNTPPQSPVLPDRTYASSISSRRSQATVSRSVSSGLKSLFASTRPRSASRAASIESERHQHLHDREPHDESFASMGSHFLGSSLRNSGDTPLGSSQSVTTHASLPYGGSILSSEHRLERKILVDRPTLWASTEPTPAVKERANRTMSLGALSLQPPPRKRWTSIGPTTPTSNDGMYRHTNGNSSKAGSFAPGGSQHKAETESPSSPSLAGFSFGTPEQRPRAPSIQSVSTLASAEHPLSVEISSSGTKRSSMKRWSKQGGVLPRRLTPPSGPPPSVPNGQASTSRTLPHPYAGERPSSRASTHSAASQSSFVSSLPSFSKRASGSSAFSVKTSSTSYSNSASRPASIQSHRLSMPPPPRPAPTFALPPAPDQESLKAETPTKSSFRDSVAHRGFRLSMIAPKPPPSTVLPPRPDEPEYKSHRRSSSTGSYTHSTPLDSIPASPIPPALTVSPFPPPVGPLPPTPATPSQSSSPPQRSSSRHTSIKRRLRILSAPSPPMSAESSQQSHRSSLSNGAQYLSRPVTANGSIPNMVSPPATPIAEKITQYQNDPSFLQIQTPPTTFAPPPQRPLPTPPEQLPELTSLSPPPRRGSKQISVLEIESLTPVVGDDKSPVEGEHKLMSLSRPGSVISLGIVNV